MSSLIPPELRSFVFQNADSYRLYNRAGIYEPFRPYERGFVGYFGNASNLRRERVNEGGPNTPTYPRQWEGVNARQVGNRGFVHTPAAESQSAALWSCQICPAMVGPVGDNKYYCNGKEYGYCDRRSGTCFCNMGYMGIDCSICTNTHFELGGLCYPKKICPNDCSGGGCVMQCTLVLRASLDAFVFVLRLLPSACNHTTGECLCDPQYWGDDCSQLACHKYNRLCEACTNTSCIRCVEGWSVSSNGTQCEPCDRFDPRSVA